jgi:hypothetical protein
VLGKRILYYVTGAEQIHLALLMVRSSLAPFSISGGREVFFVAVACAKRPAAVVGVKFFLLVV